MMPVSGWFGLQGRKIGVEILVLSKLAFPIVLLSCKQIIGGHLMFQLIYCLTQ